MEFNAARLSSQAFRGLLKKTGKLILPTGSTEICGLHAPLGTDNLVAEKALSRICEITCIPHAPLIPYGDTLELPPGEGTVHIPAGVLEEFYYAAASSFFLCPELKQLFFINFHSVNNRAADSVCRRLRADGKRAYLIDWWKTVASCSGGILNDTRYGTGHGSEMISSVLMAFRPDCVNLSAAENADPKPEFGFYAAHMWNSGSPFLAYGNFSDYAEQSVWGEVRQASAEKGEKLAAGAIEKICDFIKGPPGAGTPA